MSTPSVSARQNALMTYAEAAMELGISKRTLRRWVDAGRIPIVTLSPRVKRLRRIDLRLLIHECMTPDEAHGGVTL